MRQFKIARISISVTPVYGIKDKIKIGQNIFQCHDNYMIPKEPS